ncbi:tannase/feruloyl esterase family alpha/beta hydrolase [Sphaerotilus mobilis]|uniref:Feruloyl esterase n=1 Tax=Sphaerotilus mobilis TaxID=47994 RepID=A0A4Q7L9J7_9BURK|nr:tannase/feruloyl esterase family alpha/beta hydrolase [Sphaerotilus mobilis]RZS46686.1 feruloyl esterase [Sphaerotilus mobilis]
MHSRTYPSPMLAVLSATTLALAGCGGGNAPAATPTATAQACDDGLKTSFAPDANTTVLLVKSYAAGDPLALPGTPASPVPPVLGAGMCLVKMVVGPGNAGTAGAPSTTRGVGIEVWLPTQAGWNERIRAFGSGGWAGGRHTDITRIGYEGASFQPLHLAALANGYAVVVSDHGKTTAPYGGGANASFMMNPDGSINQVSWQDFSERAIHEMAEKSKALVKHYYARPHQYAYWEGFSTGGRQGLKSAQKYPGDFDGILAGAPAINWTNFITSEMYPQTVMWRDLGGVIAASKLNAVSASATAACDAAGLGFILNPASCRYDPTQDAAALCTTTTTSGATPGSNADTTKCLSLAEAQAVNKTWYGHTHDGSVPDPFVDNGSGTTQGFKQLWWGLTRGTSLTSLAGTNPFPISSDNVALILQSPQFAQTAPATFVNATAAPADRWRSLTYADLANVNALGVGLQPWFSHINTDNPNLAAFRDKGGKILTYHGLADELITPQGSVNYYAKVEAAMGGNAEVQKFHRLFLIPGMGHNTIFKVSALDPATGAIATTSKVPLPALPINGGTDDQLFTALRNWVENGTAPSRMDISSSDASVTLPICAYPKRAVHSGTGSVRSAASYTCS